MSLILLTLSGVFFLNAYWELRDRGALAFLHRKKATVPAAVATPKAAAPKAAVAPAAAPKVVAKAPEIAEPKPKETAG